MNEVRFPEGFLWGTATAAHQVEGNNTHNDWWPWERKNPQIPNSGLACNHYNLYKEDFDLAREVLHNNAHRLSIEWSRIEPIEGKFSEKEIEHYRNVLKELRARGIKAMVTLHHYTNPAWFAKMAGWEKKENLKYFERFTSLVAKELGSLIDYWVVINEPNVYAADHYIKGLRPPQKKNLLLAARVFGNLAEAHRRAFKIIHANIPGAQVGSAISMGFFKARHFLDMLLRTPIYLLVNYLFLILTEGYNDYIGINYYFFHVVKLADLLLITKKIKRSTILRAIYGKRNDLDWPIYPEGIYEVVHDIFKRFKKPIIITENGVADKNDSKRPRFIVDHLTWLAQAIKEGVDIKGYFHWTIMDNIEWDLGKKPKFGLFETNFETFRRTPRPSAYVYGEICKENGIPPHRQKKNRP